MNEEEFNFSIVVQTRFSDIDSLGHVNNAVYLSYFEDSRVHYFRHVLDIRTVDSASLGIIVLEFRCRYNTPVYFGESLKVFSRISWMKNKSMEMQYLASSNADKRIVAEGSSILVAYDYSGKKSIEIPDVTRRKISEFEKISMKIN